MNNESQEVENAASVSEQVWVSIIIPCYNHGKFIHRTLDSILADTYPFKEIVILNDGSKDNSDEKIREWIAVNSQRIKITYTSRENKGIMISMNELIGQAKGKYILPIASDDCLYGNTISQRVQILENETQKTVLINDAYVIDAEDNIVMQSSATDYWKADKSRYHSDEDILKEFIKGIKLGGPVLFYRKAIFEEIGKFPDTLVMEDWYFYQRAASLNRILFLDFKVALYRVHGGNMSGANTTHAVKLASHILKVYRMNFSFYPGLKYKLLAIKGYIRVLAWYIKLRLKK